MSIFSEVFKFGAAAISVLLLVLWHAYEAGAFAEALFAAMAGALLGSLWVFFLLYDDE